MSGIPVKISVIIPVYNVEKYLSACLTSCINQTLNDVEFVCVNDGSTDRSLSILKEFAAHDHRIRIINKSNGGVSSARNVGLREAEGQYVMFLDSDDYLEPNACERVWLEKLNAPTDIVIFSAHIFPHAFPTPSAWYYSVVNAPTCRYQKFTTKVLFGENSTRPFAWHQAFRKELLVEHGLEFREDVKHGEDMVFLLETYPHAQNFAFLQDKLYHYRWYREGSLMWNFKGDMDKQVRTHISIVDIICQYWEKQGWFELYGKEYLEWMLNFIVYDICSEQTKNASEHLHVVHEMIHKYNLEPYLGKVSMRCRRYVRDVKREHL